MAVVSIIIPTKEIDDYTRRCVFFCKQLTGKNEIIVVTDKECPGFPSAKRNWAMKRARGKIYAFIDSDAYPDKRWLKNALYWLKCFPAVCGPGVLPPDAPIEERIADQVHQRMFSPYRVIPQSPRIVKWFPTFNLIVKKEFAVPFKSYLTGEDDKFCEKIPVILYHPDILVYHNRRGVWKPIWRQFGQWGKTKGHFNRLSLIAWVSTVFVYVKNWLKGFFREEL